MCCETHTHILLYSDIVPFVMGSISSGAVAVCANRRAPPPIQSAHVSHFGRRVKHPFVPDVSYIYIHAYTHTHTVWRPSRPLLSFAPSCAPAGRHAGAASPPWRPSPPCTPASRKASVGAQGIWVGAVCPSARKGSVFCFKAPVIRAQENACILLLEPGVVLRS